VPSFTPRNSSKIGPHSSGSIPTSSMPDQTFAAIDSAASASRMSKFCLTTSRIGTYGMELPY
jgi:hypothetical protein